MEKIRVECPIDRSWDPISKEYDCTPTEGVLIDISLQGASNNLTPVGIVMFDDGTFDYVPLELINKKGEI